MARRALGSVLAVMAVIFHVARDAVAGRMLVSISSSMTSSAARSGMATDQWKASAVVIEGY